MNNVSQINLNNPQKSTLPIYRSKAASVSEDNGKSNTAKYMIGATLLAGTIALGIIGHKNNWWRKATQTVNEYREMTYSAFKEGGNRIDKGKAILSDGRFFTGKITKNEENGKRLVLEYNNGILNKSSKYDGENLLFSKEYKYNDKGFLSSITTDKGREIKFIRDENLGKLIEFNQKKFYYSKDGKLKYMDGYVFKNHHGNDINSFVEIDPTTKKPIKALSIPFDNYYEFDSNGKVKLEVYKKGLTDISKSSIYRERDPHIEFPEAQVLSMADKDGFLRWTRGVDVNDNLWDEIHFGDFQNPIRIVRNKAEKAVDMHNNTNSIVLDGKLATISFNHKPCARYNMETKRLEFLPQNTYSRDEIMNVYNDMMAQANLAKSKLRNAFKYTNKRFNFYEHTYDRGFRIKYPHIET